MNRHRSNWSAMYDMNTEQSQQSKDYSQMREDLQRMINRFGFDEIVSELRRIKENGAMNLYTIRVTKTYEVEVTGTGSHDACQKAVDLVNQMEIEHEDITAESLDWIPVEGEDDEEKNTEAPKKQADIR